MAGRFRILVTIGAALSACSLAIRSATEAIARFCFELIISIVPNQRSAFAFGLPGQQPNYWQPATIEPMVERHEAGMSRRAAARHI